MHAHMFSTKSGCAAVHFQLIRLCRPGPQTTVGVWRGPGLVYNMQTWLKILRVCTSPVVWLENVELGPQICPQPQESCEGTGPARRLFGAGPAF